MKMGGMREKKGKGWGGGEDGVKVGGVMESATWGRIGWDRERG